MLMQEAWQRHFQEPNSDLPFWETCYHPALARGESGLVGKLARGIDVQSHVGPGFTPAAHAADLGQHCGTYQCRSALLALSPGRLAALHPTRRKLAQHGGVDPASAQSPRLGRTIS
jgi:hypothetical protein